MITPMHCMKRGSATRLCCGSILENVKLLFQANHYVSPAGPGRPNIAEAKPVILSG